jgi:putative flavoprotein involved in K+ transport
MSDIHRESIETLVIGGGQAGLATSYHLKRMGMDNLILDENDEVGAAWRNRWDSLRLFTPGRYDGLPGMRYPGPRNSLPSKDGVADYRADYLVRFQLPIRNGIRVTRVSRDGGRYVVESTGGAITAANVVVTTGGFHTPRVPDFAASLGDEIVQMHSTEYRSPVQIPEGPVLVVGAGQSGAEIALDLVEDHRVWLSGRDNGEEPARPGSAADRLIAPIMVFVATRVIDVANPVGRKVRDHFLHPPRGIPRAGGTRKRIRQAGIEWVGRTVGTDDGRPRLENGRVLDIASVIWCTGFVPDYDWIDLPAFDEYGYPVHERGVVASQPGLYFVGLPFQRTLSSTLLVGVGRDAGFIADYIKGHPRAHTNGETVRST